MFTRIILSKFQAKFKLFKINQITKNIIIELLISAYSFVDIDDEQ